MNRDDSVENAAEEKAETKAPRKMRANQTDVMMGKRMQITKAAKRFERYGHVKDGRDLVGLVSQIAGEVEGKDLEVEVTRRPKPDS